VAEITAAGNITATPITTNYMAVELKFPVAEITAAGNITATPITRSYMAVELNFPWLK
jgi:hypothetical protein